MPIIKPPTNESDQSPQAGSTSSSSGPATRNRLSERQFSDTDVPYIKRDQNGQLCIDVSHVRVPENRGRKVFDGLVEMKESLEKFGFFSPPVLAPAGNDMYDLIAGERRFRGFMLTGERYMPFVLKSEYDALTKKEAELEENLRRKDLSWVEQVELMRQIDEIKRSIYGEAVAGGGNPEGWTLEKTAKLANVGLATASRHINIAKALKERPELKQQLAHLPLTAAIRQLERIKTTEEAQKKIASNEITVTGDVILGDARELIKAEPTASYDAIITDPPFGNSEIQQQRNGRRGVQIYTGTMKPTDNMSPGEVRVLLGELIPEMFRVLKPDGYLFMFFAFEHYAFLQETLRKTGFDVEWEPTIWNKGRSTGAFLGYKFPLSYEPILVARKEKARRLAGRGTNIIECDPVHSTKKKHNFQKPPKLLAELIHQCTRPGDKILDPFGGSAELVRVAKALNRSARAFEIDSDNWTQAQLNLNEPLSPDSIKGIGEPVKAPGMSTSEANLEKLIALSKGE